MSKKNIDNKAAKAPSETVSENIASSNPDMTSSLGDLGSINKMEPIGISEPIGDMSSIGDIGTDLGKIGGDLDSSLLGSIDNGSNIEIKPIEFKSFEFKTVHYENTKLDSKTEYSDPVKVNEFSPDDKSSADSEKKIEEDFEESSLDIIKDKQEEINSISSILNEKNSNSSNLPPPPPPPTSIYNSKKDVTETNYSPKLDLVKEPKQTKKRKRKRGDLEPTAPEALVIDLRELREIRGKRS